MEDAKRRAAARALDLVQPGQALGLGTGSTAAHFVELLGEKVRAGFAVTGVPTSRRTEAVARACGVPLTTLDATPVLDLAVDGADEVDPALRLIKGGGGSLLREKIVAAAARRMIVIVDASKMVDCLGKAPLPIEVDRFGLAATRRHIVAAAADFGCAGPLVLREVGGHAFVTDGGHDILDCAFGVIPDPEGLAAALATIPGVVEHGLFIGMASAAIVATDDGIWTRGEIG